MTMTSGVGTQFDMAPEMVMSSKHYTATVDVNTFGIMAAQVMVDRLKYDHGGVFETQYGLLTACNGHTNLIFEDTSIVLEHSVCECGQPQGTLSRYYWISGKMGTLIVRCWDATLSVRPCLLI